MDGSFLCRSVLSGALTNSSRSGGEPYLRHLWRSDGAVLCVNPRADAATQHLPVQYPVCPAKRNQTPGPLTRLTRVQRASATGHSPPDPADSEAASAAVVPRPSAEILPDRAAEWKLFLGVQSALPDRQLTASPEVC